VTTGELLRDAIERKPKLKDKTQYEVAEYLDVPPGTLSEWLSGKYEPSLESLRNVAKRLDVTVASLIGNERAAKAGKAS
jgi:transcriptional regulator with XRE-family HTH domain